MSDRCLPYGAVVRVYVASPLGFSEASEPFYRRKLLDAIKRSGLRPVDPWADRRAKRELGLAMEMSRSERRRETLQAINARVGEANARRIRKADGMLAVLDGVDVDSGTAAEIGFAAALEKPIVGLRLDTRQTGDNEGASVNLQVEHFIHSSGGDLAFSVRQAVDLLSNLLSSDRAQRH
jgi:nucleoside 2-deoxyribosyltransferase